MRKARFTLRFCGKRTVRVCLLFLPRAVGKHRKIVVNHRVHGAFGFLRQIHFEDGNRVGKETRGRIVQRKFDCPVGVLPEPDSQRARLLRVPRQRKLILRRKVERVNSE
ncbi:hypothetical protein SDC9_188800 [bioreactor metagenome]|uniref:Uncharacterized protein n=1 Tax=bioreactor metagenome TaxID=1076179 RepID=A0A645HQC5_9ZZZZ